MITCCCTTNICGCTFPKVLTSLVSVGRDNAASYLSFADEFGTTTNRNRTLTYGPKPAAFTNPFTVLTNLSTQSTITLPANGWWSAAIAGTSFGNPTTLYFYGYIKTCGTFMVMICNDGGSSATRFGVTGMANGSQGQYVASKVTCTPFVYGTSGVAGYTTGTHGGDDVTPDGSGNAGRYS